MNIELDPNDPDFQPKRPCNHVLGDPDCDCRPETEEDEEPVAKAEDYPAVSTHAPIQVALVETRLSRANLNRLMAYKGEVLADPSDARAAKALDAKRREVKGYRTAWVRACVEGRDEAVRIQKEWIAAERGIALPLQGVEKHLENEADRHEAWKAEQARLAEEARLARIRSRVEALAACGAEIEMGEVEGLEDAEWDDYLAQAQAAAARKREAEDRARNLTALGDECSPEEASYLTEDQYAHRLLAAQQAQREREERARIEAEEKAERERLEAEEKARREALRPERERIAAWARNVLDTMAPPAIQDPALRDRLEATVNGVRESLRALEKAMG